MQVFHRRSFLLIIGLVFLLSCNKDQDETPPTVSITAPSAMSAFQVYDAINVKAEISDNVRIQSVKVEIVNSDYQGVVGSVTHVVEAATYSLNTVLYLDDIHIETGQHFVRVTATDGENDQVKYQEIHITGVPLERQGILLVSENAGTLTVNKVDDTYSLSPFYTAFRDFSGASISSYYQYFCLAGSFNDPFTAFTLDFFDELYSVPAENTWPEPYFYEVNYSEDSKLTYVSTSDNTENIKGYNRYGTVKVSLDPFINHRPHYVLEHSDYVLVEQEKIVGTDVEMVVYYKSTGALAQSVTMNRDVIGMYGYDDDNALVFANASGQAKISMYVINDIPAGNYFWDPTTVDPGQFYASVQIAPNLYAVSHDDGIMIYDHSTWNLTTIVPGVVPTVLAYDEVNNVILAADGADLHAYDLAGGLVAAVFNGGTIEEILVWYNK